MKQHLRVYLRERMMYNTISQYDYEQITYHEGTNHDSFKIITGQYTGTIVTFGEIAITEPLDGETEAKLKFQYQIDDSPLNPEELKTDAEFNVYVGDLLTHIIETAIEENNFAIGDDPNGTESTNNNTEESSQ